MTLPSSDITKALAAELNAVKERYIQFQTRIKAANEAARARDEEARQQNAILTERIINLERGLKQAKESIEVHALFLIVRSGANRLPQAVRQFCELLPTVKTEFDAFENEVEAFEAIGSDHSALEQFSSTSTKVDGLESRVKSILDLDSVRRFHLPAKL